MQQQQPPNTQVVAQGPEVGSPPQRGVGTNGGQPGDVYPPAPGYGGPPPPPNTDPPPPQVAVGIPVYPPPNPPLYQRGLYQQGPGGHLVQAHYTVVPVEQHDPNHYTVAFIFSACCGLCGIFGYLCHHTKYYILGFISGFGLWLALLGLFVVIANSTRGFVPGIILGVLMILGGVPTLVIGVRRKLRLDQSTAPTQSIQVRPMV